jgi:hypothetical protein
MKLEFETLAEIVADPTLDDNDLVKDVTDPGWYVTVGELRDIIQPQNDQIVAGAYLPPDPYAKDLAALRAAEATPESTFEEEWKKRRLSEFEAEARQRDAHIATHPSPPRLTTAELKTYAPPDPWKADLEKLRERDARALAAKKARR